MVDAGKPFVGELGDAVQRRRTGSARLGCRVRVSGVVDGGGACVDDCRDPLPSTGDGLEHVRRALDVHPHSETRARADEGHLQRGQMHDPGDRVLVERRLDRVEVGDITADELDLALGSSENQLEP